MASTRTNTKLIESQVALYLPQLRDLPKDDLAKIAGEMVLSDDLYDPGVTVTGDELHQAGYELMKVGYFPTGLQVPNFGQIKKKAEELAPRVKKAVCAARSTITDEITTQNVTKLVGVVLPTVGVTGAVPLAVIGAAVFILKIGLDVYCAD